MASLTLHIEGMSCGHCLNAVNRGLSRVPGVEVRDVKIGRATVEYDPARVTETAIVAAVEQEGYRVAGRD